MVLLAFLQCTDDGTVTPPDSDPGPMMAQLPSTQQLENWLENYCATPHRIIGTEEWLQGINNAEEVFQDIGLENITRDEFPIWTWAEGS